jgi:hypothetical protein
MGDNRVGAILVRDYNLGQGHLDLALEWQADRGGQIGEILIEMRAVTPQQVAAALQTQRNARAARGTDQPIPVPRPSGRVARFTEPVPDGTVQVVFENWASFLDAHRLNISRGGLGLRTEEQPKIGSQITVLLTAPNGQRINLPGRVRYAESKQTYCAVGVEFDRFSDEVQKTLNALLDQARKEITKKGRDEIRWRG